MKQESKKICDSCLEVYEYEQEERLRDDELFKKEI